MALSSTFMIECITIENATFTSLLQDKGVGPDESTYESMKTKIFKGPDGRRYRDIWKLSKLYVEKIKASRERFPRYPTHRDDSAVVKRIGNIIFELRDNDAGVFVLEQGPIHTKFASMWGADNESGGPTMSDKARIFGLVTSEKYKDELNILMGRPSVASANVGSRLDRDDPSISQRNIWNRVKIDFHDSTVVVHDPSNWTDASGIEGYSEINPNDAQRLKMHQNRDTDFFKKTLFKEVLNVYRNACKKYRKDTGNGGGQPENFLDWNKNEDVKFQHFCRGQSVALLTWVFMKDRESNYILEEEKDEIPTNFQVEDSTISPVNTQRRVPSSVGKGLEDVLKTTQNTMASLMRSVTNISSGQRDSNMNYHDMAKTLELTSQMQKEMESETVVDSSNDEGENGNRRKRLKAALEKIEDGIMDSLGC